MRKSNVIIFLLILFALFLIFLDDDKKDEDVGEYNTFILEHDGLDRKYNAYIPSSYNDSESVPLLIAIHGGAGNADDAPYFFQLNDKAEAEGFIVVYPEGTGRNILGKTFGAWDALNCCRTNNVSVDDVGFIEKMIEELEGNYNIDENKIFVTGMSNGAHMSYRLRCDLSDKIAAIAPVGSIDYSENCQGDAVPTIYFQGNADKCCLWEGGECGQCMNNFFIELGAKNNLTNTRTCLPVLDYVELWAKRNGCSLDREIFYSNESAVCYSYLNCSEDFIFCEIDNFGHGWPGRDSNSIKSCESNPDGKLCKAYIETVEGEPNVDISANDMMWDFFMNHSK